MVRPEKPAASRRTVVHPVRLTEQEYARITACANAAHLSFADFVRQAALERAEREHDARAARRNKD